MTRPDRNPRRAYDTEGKELEPLTVERMIALGVGQITAYCEAGGCDHSADMPAARFALTMPVPDVSLLLKCSACGSRRIKTVPAWHTNPRMTKPGA